MAQRRKMEVTVVDESDRGLCSIFRNIANNTSQLYSQAVNQQKLAFDAGQRYAFEKLNEWVAMKMQEGKMVTVAEISAYLEDELNNSVPGSQLQELWGGGSQLSGASENRPMDPVPSYAPPMQSQDTDGNAFGSQDLEMDITPEDPIH